jgi:hypothetical protein
MDTKRFTTSPDADFIFEVDPDPAVFDTVRRAVVDELESEYQDVLSVDVREHIHVDVVDIDPCEWVVEGRLNGSIPKAIDFEATVSADDDATDDVLAFLRSTVGDRFGPHVDPDVVAFEQIGMRPRAWFVDAKVPSSHPIDAR